MHVLIVDDSHYARLGTERMIRHLLAEARVTVVDNGSDALAALARGDVDVLLLDLHLGGVSGLDVLRAAVGREWAPRAIVVLSGDPDPIGEAEARELGAGAFVLKPGTSAALGAALAEAGLADPHLAD
jgi:two-component system sensor histidine kinase RpfC